MEGIERVELMESILDQQIELVERANQILDQLDSTGPDYLKLFNYYTGPAYLEDVQAASRGEIPSAVKAGVLSEDAVFDLLSERRELTIRMLETLTRILSDKY